MPRAIVELLDWVDDGFDRKAWHGPTLRGALRGVSPEEASWRPAPGRHNIWEIALHAAYWKYTVRTKLTSSPRGRFPLKGSNWWVRPDPEVRGSADPLIRRSASPGTSRSRRSTASRLATSPPGALGAAWRGDLALLDDEHRQLREVVAALTPADLDSIAPGSAYTRTYLVRGIASHDLYHAGQVQLLKRLAR